MLIFNHCKTFFFFFFYTFLHFSNRIMYILNIASTIRKMTINELRDVIFENYYRGIEFSEENSYHSMKHLKKRSTIVCN